MRLYGPALGVLILALSACAAECDDPDGFNNDDGIEIDNRIDESWDYPTTTTNPPISAETLDSILSPVVNQWLHDPSYENKAAMLIMIHDVVNTYNMTRTDHYGLIWIDSLYFSDSRWDLDIDDDSNNAELVGYLKEVYLPSVDWPNIIYSDIVGTVGVDVVPGIYRSLATYDECTWKITDAAGNTVRQGSPGRVPQLLITIEPTDFGFVTSGCGILTEVPSNG